jgi:hypothetical protein
MLRWVLSSAFASSLTTMDPFPRTQREPILGIECGSLTAERSERKMQGAPKDTKHLRYDYPLRPQAAIQHANLEEKAII